MNQVEPRHHRYLQSSCMKSFPATAANSRDRRLETIVETVVSMTVAPYVPSPLTWKNGNLPASFWREWDGILETIPLQKSQRLQIVDYLLVEPPKPFPWAVTRLSACHHTFWIRSGLPVVSHRRTISTLRQGCDQAYRENGEVTRVLAQVADVWRIRRDSYPEVFIRAPNGV